jgi:hypothetical protein
LDGNLSEVDARALSTQIEESPEVRKRYWELASIHGMVEQSIQSASLQATTGRESAEPERRTRVSGLSRIKTGIAGLAIGVFSASVVWAFKLPQDNQPQPKIQEIVSEDFENPEQNFKRRFPFESGKWFGEISSISADQAISSASGARVAQFLDNPKTKFAYARYLIDLESYAEGYPTHSRSLGWIHPFSHLTWMSLPFSRFVWQPSVRLPKILLAFGMTAKFFLIKSSSMSVGIISPSLSGF